MKYELIHAQYTENIISGNVKKISINSEKLKTVFVEAIMDNSIAEMWNVFKEEPLKFEALTNLLNIGEDEEKQRVYYYAVIKTIIELNAELNAKMSCKAEEYKYINYKYLYPTLELLQNKGPLTQGKIAEELQSKVPEMDKIVRKVDSVYNIGASVMSSEIVKLKLRNLILKSEIGANNRRRETIKLRREEQSMYGLQTYNFDLYQNEEEYLSLEYSEYEY